MNYFASLFSGVEVDETINASMKLGEACDMLYQKQTKKLATIEERREKLLLQEELSREKLRSRHDALKKIRLNTHDNIQSAIQRLLRVRHAIDECKDSSCADAIFQTFALCESFDSVAFQEEHAMWTKKESMAEEQLKEIQDAFKHIQNELKDVNEEKEILSKEIRETLTLRKTINSKLE